MFTGIVEQVGTIKDVSETDDGLRVTLEGMGLNSIPVGGSIAVNGVCLTAVETGPHTVRLDVVPETLSRTNLGRVAEGGQVNLERPMPASGRFDGHIVQGHIDGTGVVEAVSHDQPGTTLTIDTGADLLRYIVEKGSITVDGVSLTVSGVDEGSFTVALIPHTLDVTTLGQRKPGDTVNLETDVLAKYVERLMKAQS